MDRGPKGDTGRTGDAGRTGDTGAAGVNGRDGQGFSPVALAHAIRQLRQLSLVFAFAAVVVLCYTSWQPVRQNRAACELSKGDRTMLARALTADSTYIRAVTGAASVKEDVKTAARAKLRTYDVVAAHFVRRSNVSCSDTYHILP